MIQGHGHLVLDNFRDDYIKLFSWVQEHGRPASPHGVLTYELRNQSFTLLDPLDSFAFGIGRKENMEISAVEALQLIAGYTDRRLMQRVYPAALGYGVVGERLRWQLTDVATVLAADPPTRQAVATVWDPAYDRIGDREVPCSMSYQFLFRDDALELHVHARSADVYYDTYYFTFSRCQLLLSMCQVLGVQPGSYSFHATSFHLYGRDSALDDRLHPTTVLTRPTDLQTGLGEGALSWDDAAARARFVLDVGAGRITDGVNPNAFSANEKWYLDQLRPYWVAGG